MGIADSIAKRSNCVRRAVGAIIARQGQVVSAGWNGVSENYEDCRAAGCPRCTNGGDTGSGYEKCLCIHAEQSAIADAARRGVSTIDSTLYVNLRPCLQCLAVARASGVRDVYYREHWSYSEEIERVYQTLSAQFHSFSRLLLRTTDVARPLEWRASELEAPVRGDERSRQLPRYGLLGDSSHKVVAA